MVTEWSHALNLRSCSFVLRPLAVSILSNRCCKRAGKIRAHARDLLLSCRVASSLARARVICQLICLFRTRFPVVSNTANGISFYFVLFFSFHTSFWPGSFFYMVTLLPAIWVAELKILNEKVQNGADTCESVALSYNREVGNGLVCSLHSSDLADSSQEIKDQPTKPLMFISLF